MDEHGCEHLEDAPIGQCAICERTVCGECFREIYNTMICDQHGELEDEGAWELVGVYTTDEAVNERRFTLQDAAVSVLVVDTEDSNLEVYAPASEKDDAFAALAADTDGTTSCGACRIQFSQELENCPLCGARPSDQFDELDEVH